MGKWVKCAERMPDIGEFVFVFVSGLGHRDRGYHDGWYRDGDGQWYDEYRVPTVRPDRWYDDAPPEPPEEEEPKHEACPSCGESLRVAYGPGRWNRVSVTCPVCGTTSVFVRALKGGTPDREG